jgi:hypothetical protein
MATDLDIRILEDGVDLARCTGPAPDGSCPRVAVGDLIPCAKHAIVEGHVKHPHPYAVSGQATICPVTLAAMIAVESDAAFFED